jgi:molybdopterin/thiamine biosynthesis adenylyltransferase
VVAMVASFQALAAIKILSGRAQDLDTRMLVIDAWSGRLRQINVQPALDRGDCPCCKRANYEYL